MISVQACSVAAGEGSGSLVQLGFQLRLALLELAS